MGKLYYVSHGMRRVVELNPEERDRVLIECHGSAATGGHPGVQKTTDGDHFQTLLMT